VQRIRGLIVGTLVGVALMAFVTVSLHATQLVGLLGGLFVGLSIFAVVATKEDPSDSAADAAWRKAAPDLPPVSDRAAIERRQSSMPGPQSDRRPAPARVAAPAGAGQSNGPKVEPAAASSPGSEQP
jgi:hypothetical protein